MSDFLTRTQGARQLSNSHVSSRRLSLPRLHSTTGRLELTCRMPPNGGLSSLDSCGAQHLPTRQSNTLNPRWAVSYQPLQATQLRLYPL